jgi:hypothetical protein
MSSDTLPLCECGCGEVITKIYKTSCPERGRVKGEPHRFIHGHDYPTRLLTVEERFWLKVDKRGPDECWEWTGTSCGRYGRFYIDETMKAFPAYRFSYELLVAPIPDGLVIDHLCRNPACVNPAHLEPVTHGENILRGIGPTAENAKKTHCKYGHEFTPENTYSRPSYPNGRECRECKRRLNREHLRRRRGKVG